jgi:hypothetical protein
MAADNFSQICKWLKTSRLQLKTAILRKEIDNGIGRLIVMTGATRFAPLGRRFLFLYIPENAAIICSNAGPNKVNSVEK